MKRNIWNQDRCTASRRHAMGAYLPSAKLASKAFMPSLRDRQKLRGRRPYWFVFGGPTGDAVVGGNQWTELRQICQSDFIAIAIMFSAKTSSAASPGGRLQLLDLSTMPGKGKKLSIAQVNNVNSGGSAQHPFILRKPYRFHAGRTIVAKIQNLQATSNNFQVVIYGVIDE